MHASGHGYQEELKLLLNLTKPRYVLPVHGEIRHLHANGALARQTGVPTVLLAEDGFVIDLVDGHGWIRNVELRYPMPFSSRAAEIKLQVDWMRHSADGSLRADNATITTCMFEKPHYRIVSGDLRLAIWSSATATAPATVSELNRTLRPAVASVRRIASRPGPERAISSR